MNTSPAWIAIMALMIPIVIVPVAVVARYARHRREMEHRERMRALELGRPLPDRGSWWTVPRLAAGMGVGVPVGLFLLCFALESPHARVEDTLPFAAVTGAAGIIGGTVLATLHFARRDRAEAWARVGVDKEPLADDAFDFVGRRG